MGWDKRHVLRFWFAIATMLWAIPASAEKLTFDHRKHAELKAVLDSGDPNMIDFNNKNPRYVVDLIAVKGKSAKDWTEALEIVARTPNAKVRNAKDWAAELGRGAIARCKPAITTLAEDDTSITFELVAPSCPSARAETTITRIVQGKRSLFLLSALIKGVLDQTTRQQWLALLSSAHLE